MRGLGGFAGTAASILLLALFLASLWTRTRPTRLDANVIAVLPFDTQGLPASQRYLGEAMFDLLALKAEGASGWRAVESRPVFAARRRVGGDRGRMPRDSALRVASIVGAGQLVVGTVSGDARRVVLDAVLLDTRSGIERAKAHAEGPPDSLAYMADRLAAALFTISVGTHESSRRLATLTSGSPAALRAFLEGRAADRRGDHREATRLYARALDADATFALAALGLARAAAWSGEPADLQRGARAAWRQRDRLNDRDRALLAAIVGPRFPASSLPDERRIAIEHYIALAPEVPEGWVLAGRWFAAYGRDAGVLDADARAHDAYERALAIDPGFAPALDGLGALYTPADSAIPRPAGDAVAGRPTPEPVHP